MTFNSHLRALVDESSNKNRAFSFIIAYRFEFTSALCFINVAFDFWFGINEGGHAKLFII